VNEKTRRGLLFIFVMSIPFLIGALFSYEIIKVNFPTDMADQPSFGYLESPVKLPPDDSVPIQGQSIVLDSLPTNPIPPDDVSIQRGEILYTIHCELCHGMDGKGNGPLAVYYPNETTRDLTSAYVTAQFDGLLFRSISNGFGQMPSMSENITPRERWDVINYLRVIEGIPR